MTALHSPARPDEEAAGWFVLLRDETVNEEDHRRFRIWHDASPANARAWREVERLWHALDPAFAAAELPAGSAASVVPLRPARAAPWRMLAGGALAAGIALLGLHMLPAGLMADYRSAVGERMTVLLDDGSEVELGTAAAMDVDFGPERRLVRLLAGEAFFTVTPDPDRPFVVQAAGGEVVVRGTAFNLRIDEGVRVTVTEHSVEVSAGDSRAVVVDEGHEAHFDSAGVSAVTPADLDLAQTWRHDRLVFIDRPLDEVIAEIGRYRQGHVGILGGGLGQMRVTAVFDARQPDAALETIAASLGLKVWRASGLFIALSRG